MVSEVGGGNHKKGRRTWMKKLLPKLLEIQKRVNYLQKDSENLQQKFNYVSSSKVLGEIRSLMNELNLLLVCNIEKTNIQPSATGKQALTELWAKMVWYDVDSGEEFAVPFYGQGVDVHEKGVGKALTYMEKYFLLKQFHIPTDDLDPDAWDYDSNKPNSRPVNRRKQSKPKSTPKKKTTAPKAEAPPASKNKNELDLWVNGAADKNIVKRMAKYVKKNWATTPEFFFVFMSQTNRVNGIKFVTNSEAYNTDKPLLIEHAF